MLVEYISLYSRLFLNTNVVWIYNRCSEDGGLEEQSQVLEKCLAYVPPVDRPCEGPEDKVQIVSAVLYV